MFSVGRTAVARASSRLSAASRLAATPAGTQQRWLSTPGEKRSTAVPHGIIFVMLTIPACFYALYSARFGPSEEEQIAKVEERYKKEIEENMDNFSRQKIMIQQAIADPSSMDKVSRELLEKPKAAKVAQTKRLMSPDEAAKEAAALAKEEETKAAAASEEKEESEPSKEKKKPWWKLW